jgi:hypothetical protein
MPTHDDLDFPHASTWCDQCWEQEQRSRQTAEMRRANDLKQRELDLRELGDWVEERPRPRPRYLLPAPPPPTPQPVNKLKWGQKGGMNIEPAG